MMKFEALGHAVTTPLRTLETFPAPKHVTRVTFTSDELTTYCPVTSEPDFNRPSPMRRLSIADEMRIPSPTDEGDCPLALR